MLILSMPLFIVYDVLLLTFTTEIPSYLSFLSLELVVAAFGALLFLGVKRFGKSKQWGYLVATMLAWSITAFFFIGILALE